VFNIKENELIKGGMQKIIINNIDLLAEKKREISR
jgi:hypothetical protein